MSNDTAVTRYLVIPDDGAWCVRRDDAALGRFPTRASAFAAAVALAESAVGDARRAEVICEALRPLAD